MANDIRCWKPELPQNATRRTSDRQFLLRPDPEMKNTFGACLGRAQEKFPVRIFWFEQNVNHIHPGIAPIEGLEDNVSRFLQSFHGNLARAVNRRWHREGPVWTGRTRCGPVLDEAELEECMLYAVTNPVKDGLVDSVSHYPGFTCYHHLAHGAPLEFSYVDWGLWWRHGGPRNKRPLGEYVRWVEVRLSPLPHWLDLTPSQRQARFRRLVREREGVLREQREIEGRSVFGARALERLDPRERPRNPKESGPRPLCYASSLERRLEYARERRALRLAYAEASARYRRGFYDTEFPPWTFKPPLVTIQAASGL